MKRAALAGAVWLSIAHYFVVEEIVQRAWTIPYSRRTNVISDLGALGCGPFGDRMVADLGFLATGAAIVVCGVHYRRAMTARR